MSDFHRKIHRDRMLRDMQLPAKIPADHAGTYHRIPVYSDCGMREPWGHVTLIVQASVALPMKLGARRPPKSSTHRVFVKCGCKKLIPAGRYHQHASACDDAIPTNQMALYERILRMRDSGRTWEECDKWLKMSGCSYLHDCISRLTERERDEIRRGEKHVRV